MLSQAQARAVWSPPCRGPWVTVYPPGAGRWVVRAAAREAFEALAQTFRAYGYQTRYADTGGYVCRRTTGSGTHSKHAYGIAVDSNWQSGPYGTRRTDRPRGLNDAIHRIRTRNGAQVFVNGITFSTPDPMHDEIVCSPQDLARGIDWATVPGANSHPRPTPQVHVESPPPDLPGLHRLLQEEQDMILICPGKGIAHVIDSRCWSAITVAELADIRAQYAKVNRPLPELTVSPQRWDGYLS